ncbi:maltose phosphorylase [Cutibacterium acnes JCM 18918]|nr:maltose phosphorylase [Cutibacterium acnes JCM 18918]
MILGFRTARSGMTLAVGADHEIITENEYAALIDTEPGMGKRVYRVEPPKADQFASIRRLLITLLAACRYMNCLTECAAA